MYSLSILCVFVLAFVETCIASWSGKIVFEDNFNGNALDQAKWEIQESCDNRFGSGNLECYTRRNILVSNGILKITAKKEKKEDKEYTSGRLRQRGEGFTYGAYVVRARLARGDHLWPAIWLYPIDSDCRTEEIDIAEYRGQQSEAKKLDLTAHFGRSYDKLISKGSEVSTPWDFSKDFHEFAVLWTPSKIEWYVDNRKFYEVSLTDGYFNSDPDKLPCRGGSQPFDHPNNFVLNMAVGGPFFDEYPKMNPRTWTKPTMEIDWVRVYQDD